jgi:hypothetical protein
MWWQEYFLYLKEVRRELESKIGDETGATQVVIWGRFVLKRFEGTDLADPRNAHIITALRHISRATTIAAYLVPGSIDRNVARWMRRAIKALSEHIHAPLPVDGLHPYERAMCQAMMEEGKRILRAWESKG